MPDTQIEWIPRTKIVWREQERKHFGPAELSELAGTIKLHGILEPIGVIRNGENFLGLWGQRRVMAAEIAGVEMIPAVVRDHAPSDADASEIRIIENTARQSLLPVEQAFALQHLITLRGCSAVEAARRVGMNAPALSKALTLTSLPEPIRQQIDSGAISAAAGYELAKVESPQLQAELAGQVASGKLGRDALAGLIKANKQAPKAAKSNPESRMNARLAGGRCVGIRGGEATLDGAIKTLEELLARLRPARTKGLSLPTVLRMLKDEADQS